MKTHDVQSVAIAKPSRIVFDFIAEPSNLPKWTNAFKRADAETAELVTPGGAVRRSGFKPLPAASRGQSTGR
ncbi:hypothetical protein [uncultured Roseibium sp.]|uniref:hypothetical protein n=1 Tax=uncultured Roseibium sp. TaxID=1936171 RepID=UPI003216CE12